MARGTGCIKYARMVLFLPMNSQSKARITILIIALFAIGATFFDAQAFGRNSSWIPAFFKKNFTLGLDLRGGVRLLYDADVSRAAGIPSEAMGSLRDAIERRVNLFGVSEPVVQVESKNGDYRLAVELAGVTDVQQAIRLIGETPVLEFRELNGSLPKTEEEAKKAQFVQTGLDGKFLKRAEVTFDQTTGRPLISIEFTDEGSTLFSAITEQNIGKPIGIFLDGVMLSEPIVQERITAGKAQITGRFELREAQELVRYLNAGALPVPITLVSQEIVEASLGSVYLKQSLDAALYGFFAVLVFMIAWYRVPGLLAVFALCAYAAFTLAIFKALPVTLTTAGIAGFILSIGMAVDANILVFERMKEELRKGKQLRNAMAEGFVRAWTSIRDSNISSLITAVILYQFGTSVVRGFALTLALGILVSMFTALTVTRNLLLAVLTPRLERYQRLFMSGFKNS